MKLGDARAWVSRYEYERTEHPPDGAEGSLWFSLTAEASNATPNTTTTKPPTDVLNPDRRWRGFTVWFRMCCNPGKKQRVQLNSPQQPARWPVVCLFFISTVFHWFIHCVCVASVGCRSALYFPSGLFTRWTVGWVQDTFHLAGLVPFDCQRCQSRLFPF